MSESKSPAFIHSRKQVLAPVKSSDWASEMVLNPAIIRDVATGRIHMLFRATGPWPQKQLAGKPMPYPIFLGYGWSDNEGQTWSFDLETPALAPCLEYDSSNLHIKNAQGNMVVNHANGCIEDPRLFYLESECFMTAACRMFPPGPYWEHDQPDQCCPDWAASNDNPHGSASSENMTVSVLFKVDLEKLAQRQYDEAFNYVINLTNAIMGDDRDVMIFSERLSIDGVKKLVLLQRPFQPALYPGIWEDMKPSILICAADRFEDFQSPMLSRQVLASPVYPWEKERIGASAPPIRISPSEWLLCYHGKQDAKVGYTQSFMILKETDSGLPVVTHRCPERLITADEDWEQPRKFATPCVFITGLIRLEGRLLISYGAADEKVGVMEADLDALVSYIRRFPV